MDKNGREIVQLRIEEMVEMDPDISLDTQSGFRIGAEWAFDIMDLMVKEREAAIAQKIADSKRPIKKEKKIEMIDNTRNLVLPGDPI